MTNPLPERRDDAEDVTIELTTVADPDDPRFAQFRLNERGLASRAEKRDDAGAGRFLAEGDLVVERALDAGCTPVAALVDAERVPAVTSRLRCPVYAGGNDVRRVVSGLGTPQPVIALFERPARPSVAELAARADRLVVLEAVDNPANVGAVVRNAAGLGWDGLILDHTSADPLARRALRVAMGSTFALPHARSRTLVTDLAALARHRLVALTPDPGARSLRDIERAAERRVDADEPIAVLVGAERSGLSREVRELATPVRIPMAAGVDSLNVAAATAIACWHLGR